MARSGCWTVSGPFVAERGEREGGEANVSWNPGDFTAEHMSMEVAPQWDPQEGWFRKDVVQPMVAWAEFTPNLASLPMTGPFEQRRGGVCESHP